MHSKIGDSEIRLLRIFAAVVRHNGFAAAQTELNISLPAISKNMSDLETRMGVRLCERGQGGFRLTKEGKEIHDASERLFSSLVDFSNSVTEAGGQYHGEIRFGIVDNSITNPQFPISDAIAKFNRSSHENIRFRIFVGGPIQLEQRVLDNRLHMAIGLFHQRIPALNYDHVYDTEHALYCGSQHKLFSINDDELSSLDLSNAGYVSRGDLDTYVDPRPSIEFQTTATTAYVEAAAVMVLSGDYIAYLPKHYAEYWVNRDEMRPLLYKQTFRKTSIHLITRKTGKLPSFVRAFIDELRF
ncbi:MAG: DNA-binding transcriptional LysR family regulator [Candidatus Azotimanducaceae bacterium]|jgi:DNA-binding transcriptional LysR family regulator